MTGVGCTNAKIKALVTPYPAITLEIQNYCPMVNLSNGNTQNFAYKDIFIYNSSSEFDGNNWTPDYDRDGLSDVFEQNPANILTYGVSWVYSDINRTGFSDLVRV